VPPHRTHGRRSGVGAPRLQAERRGIAWVVFSCVAWVGGLPAAVASAPRDAASPVVLPPWVIEATVDRATPAAREDSFAATLGPTSVVSAADWSGRAISTLAEALRRVPGVMLQESFGGFEPPRLSLRGSGLDSAPTARGVALLADGLPLARADGSFHSGLVDPLLFSRVEVYRGTMHMALTPAVLGGVLNAVTTTAEATPGAALRFEGGDFGQTRAQLSASHSAASLAASLARSRGWREHSRQDRAALLAGARPALGATTRLELSAYLARADYDVPGPLTLTDALTRPRLASIAVRRDLPRRDSSLARVAAQLKSTLPGGTAAAGVAWLRLRDDFFQLQGNGETDATSDDFTMHATGSRRLAIAGGEHHMLARATFSTGVNAVERYLNDRAARGARFGAYDARARTTALSLEDIVWLRPDLAVGAGVTAVQARRVIDDRHTTAGTAATVARAFTIEDLSPRLGLTWQAARDLTWRVALSRGVEPPSFDDLVAVQGSYPALGLRSRELREQRATTLEIGAQGRRGPLAWNVTAYRGRWRDEILRLADVSGLPRGAVNASATSHDGIETALRWRLLDGAHGLSLGVTSTLGRFVFDGDPVYGRNRIAGAPPHVGSAELAYDHPRGFFGTVESTWVAGRTSVDHAGRLGYGGHSLLHARIGWRRDERLVVFLAVRNLLDHAHLASTAGVLDLARAPAATTIFLPGPGRALTLGLEWKR
jgi:iron complex outermembrane receptor protein